MKFNTGEEKRDRTHRWRVTAPGRIRWQCWLICIWQDYQKDIVNGRLSRRPLRETKRKALWPSAFYYVSWKLIMWGLWPFLVNFPGFVWGKDVTLILRLSKENPNRERHGNPWPQKSSCVWDSLSDVSWSCDGSFGGRPASSYCIFYVSYRPTLLLMDSANWWLGSLLGHQRRFTLD